MNIKELQRKYPVGKQRYRLVGNKGNVLEKVTYDHKPACIRLATLAMDGKLYKTIEYPNGARVQIPIEKDGSIKWFDDTALIRK